MTDFGHAPHTIKLGDLEVRRLGYGAMRLPGPDVWGPPKDRDVAKKVLRRAIDLGVNLIDTAWYYGPNVSNELIAEALHPYPKDLVLATKLGGKRSDDKGWRPFAKRIERRRMAASRRLAGAFLEEADPGRPPPKRERRSAVQSTPAKQQFQRRIAAARFRNRSSLIVRQGLKIKTSAAH